MAKLRSIVKSTFFECLSGVFILANTIYSGVEVEYMAASLSSDPPAVFRTVSLSFTIMFTFELVLRLVSEASEYFGSLERNCWNGLDLALVVMSWVEEGLQVGTGGSLSHIRAVRMARMMRVFRIVRILRFVSSLRILVSCVLSTLRSLVWTILLLLVILYLFGLVFTQVYTNYAISSAEGIDAVRKNYGSVWQSAYTLFKAVTGGVTWGEVSDVLGQVHPVWEGVFIVYVAFTYFCVLNVVTGVFCQSAIESTAQDKDMVVQAQMNKKQLYTQQLMELFRAMDLTSSGEVSFNMFERGLKDGNMKAYLESMGITPDDAWNLFRLLDINESNAIDMDEFVKGCLQLQGNARTIDNRLLMLESHWTTERLTDVLRHVTDIQNRLRALQEGEPYSSHRAGRRGSAARILEADASSPPVACSRLVEEPLSPKTASAGLLEEPVSPLLPGMGWERLVEEPSSPPPLSPRTDPAADGTDVQSERNFERL